MSGGEGYSGGGGNQSKSGFTVGAFNHFEPSNASRSQGEPPRQTRSRAGSEGWPYNTPQCDEVEASTRLPPLFG